MSIIYFRYVYNFGPNWQRRSSDRVNENEILITKAWRRDNCDRVLYYWTLALFGCVCWWQRQTRNEIRCQCTHIHTQIHAGALAYFPPAHCTHHRTIINSLARSVFCNSIINCDICAAQRRRRASGAAADNSPGTDFHLALVLISILLPIKQSHAVAAAMIKGRARPS
jgi:hypothetical protein